MVQELSEKEVQEKIRQATQKAETKVASNGGFSLDKLIKLGQLEKTVELFNGVKVTLRTLSEHERDAAFALVESKSLEENILVKSEVIKRPILAYAIHAIDDVTFDTPEKKKFLLEKLQELQITVVDIIYLEYQKMLVEQLDIIQQGLKKNP